MTEKFDFDIFRKDFLSIVSNAQQEGTFSGLQADEYAIKTAVEKQFPKKNWNEIYHGKDLVARLEEAGTAQIIKQLTKELSEQPTTGLDSEAKDMEQAAESQSKGQSEREASKDR